MAGSGTMNSTGARFLPQDTVLFLRRPFPLLPAAILQERPRPGALWFQWGTCREFWHALYWKLTFTGMGNHWLEVPQSENSS